MSSVTLPTGVRQFSDPLPGLTIETELCRGTILLQGAHVTSFSPTGHQEVLWMSELSEFEPGRPVRGGVPVCFPWFASGRDGQAPAKHGWARTNVWQLADVEARSDGTVRVTLTLTGEQVDDLMGFPADFRARFTVDFGRELTMALTVQAGDAPLEVEEALHTYLTVGDVRQATIEGLDGSEYVDTVGGANVSRRQEGEVTFTAETDRIYDSSATTVLVDPVLGRRIEVAKQHSATTVVWNPWVDKSAAMADFGDDEWTGMCCIETANAREHGVVLEAGASHTMTATVRVLD